MAKLYYSMRNNGAIDIDSQWIDLMINCIAAGAHFNTYRMLDEYKSKIWNR